MRRTENRRSQAGRSGAIDAVRGCPTGVPGSGMTHSPPPTRSPNRDNLTSANAQPPGWMADRAVGRWADWESRHWRWNVSGEVVVFAACGVGYGTRRGAWETPPPRQAILMQKTDGAAPQTLNSNETATPPVSPHGRVPLIVLPGIYFKTVAR